MGRVALGRHQVVVVVASLMALVPVAVSAYLLISGLRLDVLPGIAAAIEADSAR